MLPEPFGYGSLTELEEFRVMDTRSEHQTTSFIANSRVNYNSYDRPFSSALSANFSDLFPRRLLFASHWSEVEISARDILVIVRPLQFALTSPYFFVVSPASAFASPVCRCVASKKVPDPLEHDESVFCSRSCWSCFGVCALDIWCCSNCFQAVVCFH